MHVSFLRILLILLLLGSSLGHLKSQAVQLEFIRGIPAKAAKGLPIYLDVCATDIGGNVDQTYSTAFNLGNNGGVTFSASPASPSLPDDGCLRFRIVPTDTGQLNLSVSSGSFLPISSGNIGVDSLALPTTAFSGEVFYPGNDPANLLTYQSWADTLNDAWERRIGTRCNDSVPNSFSPVYGNISFDFTSYEGSISDLTILSPDSIISRPYLGNLDYRIVNMKNIAFAGIKGEKHSFGSVFLSNAQVMQDSAPLPFSLIPTFNRRFTEITGDFASQNGLLFSFSPPASQFGMWIGDVETNPDITPGEMVLFNGDVELRRDSLPSRSDSVQRSNFPLDCGDYPGCGNQGTLWIEFYGAPVSDLLLIVGDDNTSGFSGYGGTEHLSFVGATMGGDCLLSPTEVTNIKLKTGLHEGGILLEWKLDTHAKGERLEIQRGSSIQGIAPLHYLEGDEINRQSYLDFPPKAGPYYYRVRLKEIDNQQGLSEIVRVQYQPQQGFRLLSGPYPSRGKWAIDLYADQGREVPLNLLDLQGRELGGTLLSVQEGKSTHYVPFEGIPGGIYFLQLGKGKNRLWQKFRLY